MTTLDPYEATLQHIELIARKRQKLLAVQRDAERQVLHRAGRDYVAGLLPPEALVALYQRYRDLIAINAWRATTDLWYAAIPVRPEQLRMRTSPRPNIDGTWRGDFPFAEDWRPPTGQSVVYVLYDAASTPCYVGSTDQFNARLNAHSRGKSFTRWIAYPCDDREAAYQLEDRLLKEHKPYLNRRAGR
ncbi:GIY-YIG nuclease family protein [Nonomuraea typhae]|uniref:GIY-YIG nuclease family protein n=1 Tax=Nonomuraea typhae TaxID=2603600 RepID=UPI0012F87E62|nr:GIY-YIG nuclease family protein [Nonomuraea typhae]